VPDRGGGSPGQKKKKNILMGFGLGGSGVVRPPPDRRSIRLTSIFDGNVLVTQLKIHNFYIIKTYWWDPYMVGSTHNFYTTKTH
jgi:hypothetical protein